MFDSIRAVAALMVVTSHAIYQISVLAQVGEGFWRYGRILDACVPMFMGISGFLLYRPFVNAKVRGRPLPSLRLYGRRRFWRIVPAFWVSLTVLTLWLGYHEVKSLEGAVTYYGFLQVYDPDSAVKAIGQAWSLDVEVVYYLALPLFVLWSFKTAASFRAEVIALAGLMALTFSWKVYAVTQASPADARDVVWFLTIPNWIGFIAIGMLLGVMSAHGRGKPWMGRGWILWPAAVALFIAAAWIGAPGPREGETGSYHVIRYTLFGLLVFLALAPAVFGKHRPFKVLNWIGMVSYSLFLLHLAVLTQVLRWFNDVPRGALEWIAWVAATFGGAFVLAAIGYYCIERPGIRIGNMRRTASEHAAP